MNVKGDEVEVCVTFSHPMTLRILHNLKDGQDIGSWLETLAWIQLARQNKRHEVSIDADLPEDMKTEIELFKRARDEMGRDTHIDEVINEFLTFSYDEMVESNDLD